MQTLIPYEDAAGLASLATSPGYPELLRYFGTLEAQMAEQLELSSDPNALANWRGARFALAMLKVAPVEAQQVLESTYPEL
jgi:hypothetical protein